MNYTTNRYMCLTTMAVLSSSSAIQAQVEAPRPNIVYVYVDDMGWGCIGANGQDERRAAGLANVLTPNIDKLAENGVNFQRGYGGTVCSPARASQQTGFHQGHSYADRNDPDNAQKAIRADDLTMGDMLKSAGYVTGYWGKWGYGGADTRVNPDILNQQTLPNEHGYDYVLAELHHVRAHEFFQPTLWSYKPGDANINLIPNTVAAYANNTNYPETPVKQSDPNYPSTAFCDDMFAFAALDFVRTQGQQYNADGTPFFALLACQIPHSPFGDVRDLPDWDEAYNGDTAFAAMSAEARGYTAMVTRIDAHLGNLLDALEDPNNDGDTSDSISDNTIVLFMSDNGGDNNDSRVAVDSNGGLRGRKTEVWEGGIRVPMVMRWPDKITLSSLLKLGTNTQMVVEATDLLPTFCDLAGIEAPLGLDGVSIAPTLLGEGEQREREFLIHVSQLDADKAIIRGYDKLVDDDGTLKLYDLLNDPDESSNISGANTVLVTELYTLLVGERVEEAQWFSNTYHSWTGADGSSASAAANWSDYNYTNSINNITYQTDTGAPQLSWTAKLQNLDLIENTALVDADLEFLALEISGASDIAKQIFDVNSHGVIGRNEIRVSENGKVQIAGGTLESLRWVDIKDGGEVSGYGNVDATLYNAGALTVVGVNTTSLISDRILAVSGLYYESDTASLDIYLRSRGVAGIDYAQVQVVETATLSGELVLTVDSNYTPDNGDSFDVLTAKSLVGTFSNTDNLVTASDGTLFVISYSSNTVTLTAKTKTDRGTPYSWLDQYGLVEDADYEAAELNDSDGDGRLAWTEYIFGTDPTDRFSHDELEIMNVAGGVELTWQSVDGRVYDVLHSADMITPFVILNTDSIIATPSKNTYTLSLPMADKGFYCLQATVEE